MRWGLAQGSARPLPTVADTSMAAYLLDAPRDVVNLDYVINVIEDPAERAATMEASLGLARRLLVVSAQVLRSGRDATPLEFGRGVRTGRGTL
jgi:hypothetical protein